MSATFHPAPDPLRPYLKPRVNGGTFYNTKKPRPYSLGTKDLAEAQAEYDKRMGVQQPKRGDMYCDTSSDDKDPTERDAFPAWIEKKKVGKGKFGKKKLEQATVDLYEGAWNLYCKPIIGGKLVNKVTVEDIQEIYRLAALKISPKTGEPISEGRLKHIDTMLSSFFNSMTREPTRYRADSPVVGCGDERPAADTSGSVSEDEVLTAREVENLASLAAIASHPNRWDEVLLAKQMELLIYILAYGGMRLGEALALEIDDLKEAAPYGEWFIWKKLALKRDINDPTTWYGKLKGKPGKIGDKVRYVPIMNAWLRERIDTYIAEGLEGRWLRPGGILFPTTEGKPRTVSGVDRRFAVIRDAAGMGDRPIPTVLHHMRHTFASWLLESGQADIQKIAELIGDTVKVCGDRYAHLGDRTKSNQQAVDAMAVRHDEPVVEPEPAAPAAISNVIQFRARRSA